jgi:hypothetical protein
MSFRQLLENTQSPSQLIMKLKQPGHEADHSPAISAEVKNTWILLAYTHSPHEPSSLNDYLVTHRNNFTATFSFFLLLTLFSLVISLLCFFLFNSVLLSFYILSSFLQMKISTNPINPIDSKFINYFVSANARERGHKEPALRRFVVAGSCRHRYGAFLSVTVSKTWDS